MRGAVKKIRVSLRRTSGRVARSHKSVDSDGRDGRTYTIEHYFIYEMHRDEYDDAPLVQVNFQSSNRSDRALPRIASLNNAREHGNKRIMTKTRKRDRERWRSKETGTREHDRAPRDRSPIAARSTNLYCHDG